MILQTKIILGISIFIVLGLIIGLSVYFSLPKSSNKQKIDYISGKTLNGDNQCQGPLSYYLFETDSTGNKPDITSNTINIDTSKLLSLIQNNGCEIVINDNAINNIYRYNITRIDANKNTITFNAPENFQLSSAEAWPIHIIYCNKLQPPEIIR